MIRSRVQEIEEGERHSKYFLSKEIFCNANVLQINDKVITQSEGVLQSYNNLCQSSLTNENSADIFLRDIDKISQDDRDLCEGITNIWRVLWSS